MTTYHGFFSAGMAAKFGLTAGVDTAALIDRGLALMTEHQVDFTGFFRALASAGRGNASVLPVEFGQWLDRWRAMRPDVEAMDRLNPVYIARNHLVEEALAAAALGDLQPVTELVDVLAEPYQHRAGLAHYADPAPAEFGPYRTFCGT